MAEDETDVYDWPASLSDGDRLRAFDRAARCPICSQMFDAPLMLPCGHACKAKPVERSFDFEN